MTESEARKIIQNYRETDNGTGEKYGYIIQEYCGKYKDAYLFRCKVEGVDYDSLDDIFCNPPLIAVCPDGTIITLPT